MFCLTVATGAAIVIVYLFLNSEERRWRNRSAHAVTRPRCAKTLISTMCRIDQESGFSVPKMTMRRNDRAKYCPRAFRFSAAGHTESHRTDCVVKLPVLYGDTVNNIAILTLGGAIPLFFPVVMQTLPAESAT